MFVFKSIRRVRPMVARTLVVAAVLLLAAAAQAQELRWAKRAGGVFFDGGFGVATAIDSRGNSCVTGRFQGTAVFGQGESRQTTLTSAGGFADAFVAKYDDSGKLVWAKRAGGPGDNDFGYAITADLFGNCYAIGRFQGSAIFGQGESRQTTLTSEGADDVWLGKFDGYGRLQWAKRISGPQLADGIGITTDLFGNSYVTGVFSGATTFGPGESKQTTLTSEGGYDIFVAKYDKSGKLVWAKRAGGAANDEGFGIAADLSGNTFVTGYIEGSAIFGLGESNETTLTSSGASDVFVAKYNAQGRLQWAKRAGGASDHFGLGIATDLFGNSYVTGQFGGGMRFGPDEANEITLFSAGNFDVFIAKYNSRGDLVWAKVAGGTGADVAWGVAADIFGNSYVTGSFEGSSVFGLGEAGETTLESAGDSDIFVAKYDRDGNLKWAESAGGAGADEGRGIAVSDLSGEVFVAGGFQGAATFGEGGNKETTLTSAGLQDIFVAQYGPTPRPRYQRSHYQRPHYPSQSQHYSHNSRRLHRR